MKNRKNEVTIGFTSKTGLDSPEAVREELDALQREWQAKNHRLQPANMQDDIRKVIHRGVGCVAYYGYRHFDAVPC